MPFAPTTEQAAIITASETGDGVIEAGAGTGKTSTLRLIADAHPERRMLYVAFNKTVQVEAAKTFPSNVEARTAHSLAYRQFGAPNKSRMGNPMRAAVLASTLNIKPFTYEVGDEKVIIEPKAIAVLLKEAIANFCRSADREPNGYNFRTDIPKEHKATFVAQALPYLRDAWTRIADPKSTFPFLPGRGDGCYLKLWSLANMDNPKALKYDTILFDEAQDANPAVSVVIEAQACQRILVGDRAQAIYGWNGAVDAMQNFTADWHLMLTQSFRFGPTIAEHANRWLNIVGTPLRLTGFEKIDSTLEDLIDPDAILCRTNAGVIESALLAQETGQKVAIAGGTKDIQYFAEAANNLMQNISTDHPELCIYHTWTEVQQAVASKEATDLGPMVRLIDNYGVVAVLNVCRQSTRPEDADVIVSTAHKAKGLEWNRVKIHTDFQAPKEGNALSIPEAMLIYVSCTRAKLTLDSSALAWLDDLETEITEALI
jgi:hypothetical protein